MLRRIKKYQVRAICFIAFMAYAGKSNTY